MRILLLTHRLPYAPNRGDRIRAYHLLRTLTTRHDVDLVSLIHDEDEAAQLSSMSGSAASVAGARVAGVRKYVSAVASMPGRRPLTHVLLSSPQMDTMVRECTAKHPPDVVVSYCSGVAPYAMRGLLRRVPMVLDLVDVDSEKWAALGSGDGPALKRWIYRREARRLRAFEGDAIRHAAATVVSSDRERVLLQHAVPGADALTVANGIDLAHFSPEGPPAPSLEVVFCGVFNYQPNEEAAVWFASHVWPRVLAREPQARLTLVGMNPGSAVRALAAAPSIRVTGAVDDVRPYLWRAAVSIAPLQLARGIQNKVLEALAAGLPCVVTPAVFDGLPEAARSGCDMAAAPSAFADAVCDWLGQPPGARRAKADRARLTAMTWDAQLRPFLGLVEGARRMVPFTPAPGASSTDGLARLSIGDSAEAVDSRRVLDSARS